MEMNSDNPLLTKILTPQEIRLVARRIKAMLPAEIFQFSQSRSRSVENTLRIGSLSKRCQVEREKLGLTIKQVAAQLKVPQYHVKAIDEGDIREIEKTCWGSTWSCWDYRNGCSKWVAANPGLARRLGLKPRPAHPTRFTATTSDIGKRSITDAPRTNAAPRKTNPLRTRGGGGHCA
jgi:hypothetical protein